MNRSKKVLRSLIDEYATCIEIYAETLRQKNNKKRKKEALSYMEEVAGKLMLACKDLKKEMEK